MIKDLMNNEELVKGITEDLEDFAEDVIVTYEVWAMGYNEDDEITDAEFLLKSFADPDAAVAYAKDVTLADVVHLTSDGSELKEDITTIQVEVEAVVDTEDDEAMNIGTVYYKTLYNKDEYADIVDVSEKDYKLLEDGSIEVSYELLKNFNKNDIVQVRFIDENEQPILTYKIISKTTANTFVCEFIY
jgi:hypothetical protein